MVVIMELMDKAIIMVPQIMLMKQTKQISMHQKLQTIMDRMDNAITETAASKIQAAIPTLVLAVEMKATRLLPKINQTVALSPLRQSLHQ
jgi:hypothetical protein